MGSKTHGGSKEKLFSVWTGMRERCRNKNCAAFKHYGGRGIKVCEEWVSNYVAFREWANNNGFSDNLSLDRINNDGNYEPDNCRWTTQKVQSNNKRSCAYLTLNGQKLSTVEWSEKTGIPRSTINNRLAHGWTVESALTTPSENQSVFYNYEGQRLELNEWARVKNIPKSTLWARLNIYHMPFEQAITQVIKRRKVA